MSVIDTDEMLRNMEDALAALKNEIAKQDKIATEAIHRRDALIAYSWTLDSRVEAVRRIVRDATDD